MIIVENVMLPIKKIKNIVASVVNRMMEIHKIIVIFVTYPMGYIINTVVNVRLILEDFTWNIVANVV
jgi:hypothetical protein